MTINKGWPRNQSTGVRGGLSTGVGGGIGVFQDSCRLNY
jgi:hypothetical protein